MIVGLMLLRATAITKTFDGVRALHRAGFDLEPGEVHALVGENGAGKSTLIRIITGAETSDAGSIEVEGRVVAQHDAKAAKSLGIAAIYQQPSLFPDLTVAENIAWALETGGTWRKVDWRSRKRLARELLERVGAAIDPDSPASALSMPEQQLVEIAKAIGAKARVLIMDEPTASLSESEVERLFRWIATFRAKGCGIVYISHRLEEIFSISDRITVLRDGETVATQFTKDATRGEIIQQMAGRDLAATFPKPQVPIGEIALEVRGLSNARSGLHDISLHVRRGEILGVAGLVGSGRTQLAETVFGLTPADSGEILVHGKPAAIESPARAIAHGIGYVPEDRRRNGVVMEMPIASNVSLASLASVARGGLIDRSAERKLASRYMRQLRIKAKSVQSSAATLSGGNQQKVAVARWLATNPSVLILDEPTQGVDVASKYEIHKLMGELARRGTAIIMISSELPEIIAMSDRIAVMHAGRIRGELSREQATPAKILSLALGHS
ncbi:MAG TPA: sugar ABC transporter ATP-binding protein [Bryobacteraceae bacterium]|nr:sugar ABC transporter ATP-binding protein [Bryobacteraceae bacterium]